MEATLTLFSWCSFFTMKLSLGSDFGCQLPSIDITPYFIKLAVYTMEFQIVSGDSGSSLCLSYDAKLKKINI